MTTRDDPVNNEPAAAAREMPSRGTPQLRRRAERKPEISIVAIGVLIPEGEELFPWELELLAPHIPELVHAVLHDLDGNDEHQD